MLVRMPVSLEFDTTHEYTDAKDGIHIPVTLAVGRQWVELVAKMDTGAANRIFERKYGETLELDVESGRFHHFRTIVGSLAALRA